MKIHESIGRFNKSQFQLRFDDVLAEAGMTREDVESGATVQELAMRLQRERTRVARLERLLGTTRVVQWPPRITVRNLVVECGRCRRVQPSFATRQCVCGFWMDFSAGDPK